MSSIACARIATFVLLTLAAASPVNAESRTFTSSDGRTVEAEVISSTPDMVTLKLNTGQTVATSVNRFSEADQTYLAAWRKEHPTEIKYALTTNYTKSKTDSSKGSVSGKTITTETWLCNMKVTNRSGQTLENLKVKYDIYCNEFDDNSSNMVLKKTSNEASISSIKNLQELVIPTKEVRLKLVQLKAGYYYVDGGRARQKEDLAGMTITILHEGKEVYSWSSNGVPGQGSDGKNGSLFGK